MLVHSAPFELRIFAYTVSDVSVRRYNAMTHSKNETESYISKY